MKLPRQHAAEIMALPTVAERRAALDRVPPEFRAMVETHIRIAWRRREGSIYQNPARVGGDE